MKVHFCFRMGNSFSGTFFRWSMGLNFRLFNGLNWIVYIRLMMALTPKRLFLSFSLSSCLSLFSAFFLALTIGSINIFWKCVWAPKSCFKPWRIIKDSPTAKNPDLGGLHREAVKKELRSSIYGHLLFQWQAQHGHVSWSLSWQPPP